MESGLNRLADARTGSYWAAAEDGQPEQTTALKRAS